MDAEIVFTGLRPGEKLHEELIVEGEDVGGTAHPKVMKLIANGKLPPSWSKRLEELIVCAITGERCDVVAKLGALVKGTARTMDSTVFRSPRTPSPPMPAAPPSVEFPPIFLRNDPSSPPPSPSTNPRSAPKTQEPGRSRSRGYGYRIPFRGGYSLFAIRRARCCECKIMVCIWKIDIFSERIPVFRLRRRR